MLSGVIGKKMCKDISDSLQDHDGVNKTLAKKYFVSNVITSPYNLRVQKEL